MITKEQIKALKKCDYLGIRHSLGKTSLEICKREVRREGEGGKYTKGFEAVYVEVESLLDTHERNGSLETRRIENFDCWCSQDNYADSMCGTPVRLLSNILRAGDQIRIRWVRHNTCQVYEEVGFVADQCILEVFRRRRGSLESLGSIEFENYVGKDNSARMIRRNH